MKKLGRRVACAKTTLPPRVVFLESKIPGRAFVLSNDTRRSALPTSGNVPCTILLSYVWVRHFFHPSFFDFCRCLQTFTLVIFSNTARIRRRMIYVCGADFTAKLASIRKLLAIFGIHRVIKASRKANPMSRRKHEHTHII